MKMLRILVLLVGAAAPLFGQNADVSKLSIILKNANVDSVEKTERLAAIFFHEKINQYRISLKKPALGWDDTVWLASRNHCNWMMANNELTHHEKPGTALFNGNGPGDRYDFASKNKGKCSWSGENALYNYSSFYSDCAKNALAIANSSFEQWKHSPGHNANMLKEGSRIHGVAFRIEKSGRVWATDLFCRAPSYAPIVEKPAPLYSKGKVAYAYTAIDTPYVVEPSPDVIVVEKPKPVVKKDKFVSASTKYVKLDIEQTTSDLEKALYSSSGIHHSKSMGKAAQRHAAYMAANSKLTHEEKKQKRKYYAGSPQKRIVKASRGVKAFRKKTTQFVESIAMISVDAATLDISELSKSILIALDKERATVSGNSTAVGFGIVIKRSKNELKVYVVREEGVRS